MGHYNNARQSMAADRTGRIFSVLCCGHCGRCGLPLRGLCVIVNCFICRKYYLVLEQRKFR